MRCVGFRRDQTDDFVLVLCYDLALGAFLAFSDLFKSISYVLSICACDAIPIARSINTDSVDLTRLSYLNSTKKRLVLDGSWTVLHSIGRSVF